MQRTATAGYAKEYNVGMQKIAGGVCRGVQCGRTEGCADGMQRIAPTAAGRFRVAVSNHRVVFATSDSGCSADVEGILKAWALCDSERDGQKVGDINVASFSLSLCHATSVYRERAPRSRQRLPFF